MMKKLKAFTLVELMVVVATLAIFCALFISASAAAKQRANALTESRPTIKFKVGDFVYFYTTPSTTVTGMVDNINREGLGFPLVASLNIQGTNGMPYKYPVNVDLLHKVPEAAENYK